MNWRKRPFHFHNGRGGTALTVRVVPRASRNEIAEIMADGTLRIRLTAPPVDQKANEALVDFLAKVLGVARSKIEIVAGHTSRQKLVSILDLSPQEAEARIWAAYQKRVA
ncbi:MAG: DUF167 domain-containing protein [Chloroflexi bacterium]|nr:DUF167 domain-containing protein [Chloroflexota bacterium]